MSMNEQMEESEASILHTYNRFPVVLDHGEGVYLYDTEGKKFQIRVREDIAIAFQHEIDHLNGILFIDHIDPKNPYKNAEKYREI